VRQAELLPAPWPCRQRVVDEILGTPVRHGPRPERGLRARRWGSRPLYHRGPWVPLDC